MHTIIDPDFIVSSQAEIDAMKAAMSGNGAQTLDEIRTSQELLSDKEDGELHQIALDAGYKVAVHL